MKCKSLAFIILLCTWDRSGTTQLQTAIEWGACYRSTTAMLATLVNVPGIFFPDVGTGPVLLREYPVPLTVKCGIFFYCRSPPRDHEPIVEH